MYLTWKEPASPLETKPISGWIESAPPSLKMAKAPPVKPERVSDSSAPRKVETATPERKP